MGIIRLLLAIGVVLFHSTPILHIRMLGGWAVPAFYVISGFYMALVLNEKYARGKRGYNEFIFQRLMRLLPAYWVCLIASIIVGATGWGTTLPAVAGQSPFSFWAQHAGHLPLMQLIYLAFSQTFLLGQDWLYYMRLAPDHTLHWTANVAAWPNQPLQFLFVAPAWSLGIELSFYLIAPFLVRRTPGAICLFICASFILRLAMWQLLRHTGNPQMSLSADPWASRFFPSEIATFFLGALGYHFYARARARHWNIRSLGWAGWLLALVSIFALPIAKQHGVSSMLIVPIMAICVPFVFTLTKNWKMDRWLGELSYPVYIAHSVVGAVIAKKLDLIHGGDVQGWMLLLWTLPIAILIRVCVEQPIDHWRQHLHNARHREPAAVISPAPM